MPSLTKAQLAEAIQTIYSGYVEGKTDEEQAAAMGIDAAEFTKLRTAMFDAKADEVRSRPTEHVYVQYMIDQARNIKDLTDMIKDFHASKQHTALVAAVKARADIYEKLIKWGQEFGMIHKDPKTNQWGLTQLIADMSNKQLRIAITAELKTLNGLVSRYGEGDIMEMDPGSLHTGPRLPAAEMADDRIDTASTPKSAGPEPSTKRRKKGKAKKNAKANNSKRHAGRVKARVPGNRANT